MYNIKKGKTGEGSTEYIFFFFLHQKEFLPGFSTTKNKFFINSFLGRTTGNSKNRCGATGGHLLHFCDRHRTRSTNLA